MSDYNQHLTETAEPSISLLAQMKLAFHVLSVNTHMYQVVKDNDTRKTNKIGIKIIPLKL